MSDAADPKRTIAFQGHLGAYSHLACTEAMPEYTPLPCEVFEDAFAAVWDGKAARAMLPVENSVAGRVADIHSLLPDSDLHIIGEHFQRVNHMLLVLPDADPKGLKTVYSHVHALAQCRDVTRELKLKPIVHADTAGAAAMVAKSGDRTMAAISSSLAAETYGLKVLRKNVQDHDNNVTRFLVMARERITPHLMDGPVITSFIFGVRSLPAALYKALGGFATNNVNITKLESYMRGGSFEQADFYADIEGHPDDPRVKLALEELEFFTTHYKLLGTYPQHPSRAAAAPKAEEPGRRIRKWQAG
jgi:prephenate dehydratase